jgi:squalene cyclase
MVSPADAPAHRARMDWAIRNCWGTGADPDVLAHVYYALWLWSRERYAALVARGAAAVLEMQQDDGSWRASWYSGPAYGTGLAVRLLRAAGAGHAARERAREFLLGTQRPDGCWGDEDSLPLQTALSMAALHAAAASGGQPMARAAAALRALQLVDGSWPASPWIQMEIGRATGRILRVATYRSTVLTTAFCLRAILLPIV